MPGITQVLRLDECDEDAGSAEAPDRGGADDASSGGAACGATAPKRGRFAPAVRSARTSAAALRQKNNSQLHPLLRNATDNAAAGATSLHGASPPGASPPGS